jgi:hypothetical protein
MIRSLGIRRRNLLFEARELQQEAQSMCTTSSGRLWNRVVKESELQRLLLIKYSVRIITHEIVHSRVEYLLVILNFLLDVSLA